MLYNTVFSANIKVFHSYMCSHYRTQNGKNTKSFTATDTCLSNIGPHILMLFLLFNF